MNPEIKAKWQEDLRSGKYKQGHNVLGFLEDGESYFCCLGVLCEQAVAAGVITRGVIASGSYIYDPEDEGVTASGSYIYDPEDEGVTGLLPLKVRDWAGLDVMDPVVSRDGVYTTLSSVNDNGLSEIYPLADDEPADFDVIADLIGECL